MKPTGIEPLSPEWHARRRASVTASDVAALLGRSRWTSPFGVWARITGRVQADVADSEAAEAGVRLEQAVADWWSEKSGHKLAPSPGLIEHPSLDYFVGTPDRRILDTDGAIVGVYEGKTTGHFRQAEWAEGPPEEAKLQLQAYLVLTGLDVGAVAALIGGQKMRWAWQAADPALADLILSTVERFWVENIEKDDPPPISGMEHDTSVLAKLYPKADGTAVTFTPQECEMVYQRQSLAGQIKELEAKKGLLENQIKEILGASQLGVGPDFTVKWTNETRHYKAQEAREIEMRVLRFGK